MPSLTTLAHYDGPLEAHIVRAMLEAQGFFVCLRDQYHVWNQWPLSRALGGIRLQVWSAQADAARAMMAAFDSGALTLAESELEGVTPLSTALYSPSSALLSSELSQELSTGVSPESSPEFPPALLRCGRCGGTVVRNQKKWSWLLVLMNVIFLGRIVFPPATVPVCAACGSGDIKAAQG